MVALIPSTVSMLSAIKHRRSDDLQAQTGG